MRIGAVAVLLAGFGACAVDDQTPVTEPTVTGPPGVATTVPATTGSDGLEPTEPTEPAEPTEPPETTVATSPPPLRGLAYQTVAELDFPIALAARPGDDVALLAEKDGVVRLFANGEVGDAVLDLTHLVTSGGHGQESQGESERGLLGMARHPTDDTRVFVHYSDRAGDTVVSEFRFEGSAIDVDSEQVIFTAAQPAANHNGGMIQFGPDGALYLGMGDGGGAGDRFGHAQDTGTLLGGIVRIDVDTVEAELWQHGLRNPWRFWIDGDDIWIGDVGQDAYEEIDLASITEPGINYGWPILEGLHCFQEADCDIDGLLLPLVEVARGDAGSCSITGGVVYRGAAIPEIEGRFLFSDYCGGYLRSVDAAGEVTDHTDDVGVAGQVVSFGVGPDGEVYVMTVDRLLRLEPVR